MLPSEERRSFVRTNAPPFPGLTCWNSTILKIVPSTSMWFPFLNWLVEIMRGDRLAAEPSVQQRVERDQAAAYRTDGQRPERGADVAGAGEARRQPRVGADQS